MTSPPFTEDEYDPTTHRIAKPRVELFVDRTGVGEAILDLFKERGLTHKLTSVTITGTGTRVNSIGGRSYSVPKVDLVAALEVPLHKGILRVAKGLTLWPTLRGELLNFRRK